MMLLTSIQMILVTAIMLVQPAHYGDDLGQVSDGSAVARSDEVPPAPRPAPAVGPRQGAAAAENSKPASLIRVAKKPAAPPSKEMPRTKIADMRPAAKVAASNAVQAGTTVPHPVRDADSGSNTKTIQQQVTAATATAEHAAAAKTNNAGKTALAPTDDTDLLVAIVMARPEIKSVSDLAGKSIAIDDRQSRSHAAVRTAIAAAGAAEVQLSEGATTAINRVASGEVPAAVLTLVSPEAAEVFPDIAGFRIFRIPLSPRSLKPAADAR
jgi:hypothetical protein